MNKLKFLLTIPVLSLIISCGGDSSEDINASPGSFNVSISDITSVSASISWTEPTDDDGDEISYSIETSSGFGGGEAVSLSSTTSGTITGLSADTQYAGKIIASDGNGGESSADFSFTTTSADCTNDNSISNQNVACDLTPETSNTYDDNTINMDGKREIVTNGVPTHDYANQLSGQGVQLSTSTKTYYVAADPSKSASSTSITNDQNRPNYRFGIAKNGVPLDPAPAEPFIFEVNNPGGPNDGEYNWDWVFEPTNNATSVGLDCAFAHVQPDGTYHYHGNMIEYANELLDGLGDGTATPSEPIQIGWAADGFPVYYKYAPTTGGSGVEQLSSGYALKSGDRPGDGITEPCGEYNGKYTNDYEWSASNGDLDECNGIDRSVTIGAETYEYFYIITEEFPVIPRCLVGTPDNSFKLGM